MHAPASVLSPVGGIRSPIKDRPARPSSRRGDPTPQRAQEPTDVIDLVEPD